MAGGLYAQGYDGLAFVLGWTGGYVLVAVLIAPYLRKFGAYTVPDFLGARFGGNFARSIGILVLFACSFTYIVGQVVGVGTIASRFLGISFEVAVFVGLIGILVCSMMGGMRAVTWTQVAQYIVLIIAYLVPVVILSAQTTGIPVPQLMYGGHVEVALRGRRRADAHGLVRQQHVLLAAVGGGVHRDGLDAEFAAGAQDAQGDFTPVRDDDLVQHGPYSMMNKGWPNSTGSPLSAMMATMVPAASLSIWFIIFIASMMHSVSPTSTLLPICTKGFAPGAGAP